MRRLLLPLLLIVAATTAHAEPSPPLPKAEPAPGFALATNLPLAWVYSWAVSGWMALDDHQAIRVNVARYGAFPLIFPWDDVSHLDFGATTDLGAGWVYYPRHALDGPSLEAGALLRVRRTRDRIDDNNVASVDRNTNTYGGRALVGWTWRPYGELFVSLAAGASVGYERGNEQALVSYHVEPMRTHVSRADVSAEAYLRFGFAFGG